MATNMSMKVIPGLYIVETIFTFLATLAVCLRLWARRLTKRQLAISDYAAIGALIGDYGFAVTAYIGFYNGIGQHMRDLTDPQNQIVVITKCLLALEALWAITNVLVKVSILTLYLDLFRGKWFKITCYATMAISFFLLVAVMLEVGLLCRPFEYNWNKYIPGTCGNTNQAYEAVGILNLITDLTIVILPMPVLWGLQMPVAKKVALTFMFGVGALICIISILRVLSLSIWTSSDFTYGMRDIAYWSLLEPALGTINCCLPLLGPIISKATSSALWTKVTRTKGGSGYSKGAYGGGGRSGGGGGKSRDLEAAGSGGFKRLDDPAQSYYMEELDKKGSASSGSGASDFDYVGKEYGGNQYGSGKEEGADPFSATNAVGRGESTPMGGTGAGMGKKALPRIPAITVRRDWEVQSESQPGAGGRPAR